MLELSYGEGKKSNFVSIYYNLLLFIGYFISTIILSCGICEFYTTEMNCNKPAMNILHRLVFMALQQQMVSEICAKNYILAALYKIARARASRFHRPDSFVLTISM